MSGQIIDFFTRRLMSVDDFRDEKVHIADDVAVLLKHVERQGHDINQGVILIPTSDDQIITIALAGEIDNPHEVAYQLRKMAEKLDESAESPSIA